jgi:tetratricopeptide (TPR) repeat protein
MSCFGMIAHRSSHVRALICALVILFFVPSLLKGQSPSPGASATVQGFVRDAQGLAVPGATVALQSEDGKQALTTRTDSDGRYGFSAVSQGTYNLRAEMAGYREATLGSVTLAAGQEKRIDLRLEFAGASLASSAKTPEFFDEPRFTVAGVTDTTSLGGHGSDTVLRTREALAKETGSLGAASPATRTVSSNATAAELREEAEHIRALMAHQDTADLHHRLADIDERTGKPLEAVHEYQRAAELDPSEPNLFDWGTELLLHRAPEPAMEVFTKGNRLFPRSVRMLVSLGVAWYTRGSYDEAARRLCEASDLSPADSAPYLFLGKIQSVEATPSEAIAERLARFVRLQPENAMANYYFAVSLWKGRKAPVETADLEQVETPLEKAVRLDPKLGTAYLQLGIVHAERNDLAGAISFYRQAAEVSPGLEEPHYRLAQAYRVTGEKSKAQAELQLYQETVKAAAGDVERERREVKQFVYTLRNAPATTPR